MHFILPWPQKLQGSGKFSPISPAIICKLNPEGPKIKVKYSIMPYKKLHTGLELKTKLETLAQ